jgi:hypothetical protein
MRPISFKRHRFPPEIIRHAVWLYARFTLSLRDVEELLAERGIDASYETVRRWFLKFGPSIAANIRRSRPGHPPPHDACCPPNSPQLNADNVTKPRKLPERMPSGSQLSVVAGARNRLDLQLRELFKTAIMAYSEGA